MNPEEIIELFARTDAAVKEALSEIEDWGLIEKNPLHPGQHYSDIVANNAALAILEEARLPILSEESGLYLPGKYEESQDNLGEFDLKKLAPGEYLFVIDPLDGSTNALKRIPFYAVSICALDADGPVAGYVASLASQDSKAYTAIRGEGAQYGSSPIQSPGTRKLEEATVAASFYAQEGIPEWTKSSKRVKCLGAAALEICMVGSGSLDVYIDCTEGTHSPWDYLAASLICTEAGAEFTDVYNRDTNAVGMEIRRCPLAASSLKLIQTIQKLVLEETGA